MPADSISTDAAPREIRLADYAPPAFLIDTVDLHFDLDEMATTVVARLMLRRNLAAPADATSASSAAAIRNCAKTQHGVTVRIKMRDNGRFTRIRISHPHGRGVFHEPRLHHVDGSVAVGFISPPDEDGNQIGSATRDRPHHLSPSFRSASVSDGYTSVSISARFKLDNGKAIRLSCSIG